MVCSFSSIAYLTHSRIVENIGNYGCLFSLPRFPSCFHSILLPKYISSWVSHLHSLHPCCYTSLCDFDMNLPLNDKKKSVFDHSLNCTQLFRAWIKNLQSLNFKIRIGRYFSTQQSILVHTQQPIKWPIFSKILRDLFHAVLKFEQIEGEVQKSEEDENNITVTILN